MKILIACNTDSYPNPYVKTLYRGFLKRKVDVTCSLEEFWANSISYDVIHIQWPNLLVDESDEECTRLISIFKDIKRHNIPLICTCHNLVPHYNSSFAINNTYRIVYNNSDFIHHLGEVSIQQLKDLYPDMHAEHFVVPHHTYDELYNLDISRNEARKKLGIPLDAACILSVGMFRHEEERKILINLRKKNKDKNFYILAPGFFWTSIIRRNIFLAIKALFLTIKYHTIARYYRIQISNSFLPDSILPTYLKAADVMLIQRKKILNSGNVSLAMLAGLPIVGPNDGNVEDILRKTGNYIFDKNNLEDLPNFVECALADKTLGYRNYEYAMEHLTTNSVVDSLISIYRSCILNSKKIEYNEKC